MTCGLGVGCVRGWCEGRNMGNGWGKRLVPIGGRRTENGAIQRGWEKKNGKCEGEKIG